MLPSASCPGASRVQRGRVLWACARPAAPWDGSGKKRAPVGRGLGMRPGTVSAPSVVGELGAGAVALPSPLARWSVHSQHTCCGLPWGPHACLLPLLDPHASSACGAPVLGPAQRQREALRAWGEGPAGKPRWEQLEAQQTPPLSPPSLDSPSREEVTARQSGACLPAHESAGPSVSPDSQPSPRDPSRLLGGRGPHSGVSCTPGEPRPAPSAPAGRWWFS